MSILQKQSKHLRNIYRPGDSMALDELYLEYANEPLTEDLFNKLCVMQKQALAEKNMSVYTNTILLMAKYHESVQDYDQAVEILKNSLKEENLEDYSQIVSIIDTLVGLLLKTEDFAELEQVLNYRERFLEHKKSYQLMQKFYLAVCYEGLKQNQKAISCLLDVEDTMSNNNLVSKYLKLSLLYILEKKYSEAKAMYEHAKIFDPDTKNSMFHLVHSDICFYQSDYAGALEAYQNYFISTKNKFRYLDRFIYISIKLENYQEALDFYHEYLSLMEKQISKHAKKMFYEAGIELYTVLKDVGSAALLKEKIANLYIKEAFHVDSFFDLYTLLDKTKSSILISNPRDAVLDIFRQISELFKFSRLVFLYLADDGFVTLTFSKGLLMEKQYVYDSIKSTLIDKIMSANASYQLYSQADLCEIPDYLDKETMTMAMFCIAKKTIQPVYPNGTLLVFLDNASSFDRANKLFLFANALLEDKLENVSFQTQLTKTSVPFRESINVLGKGLISIEKGLVYFLNDLAKSLFESSAEFMRFDELQKFITSKNKIFLDDFLHHDTLEIYFVLPSGKTSIFEFRIWHHELVIYALVQDITDQKRIEATREREQRGHSFYGLKNLIELENAYLNSNPAKAFLVIRIENFPVIASHYEQSVLLELASELEKASKASARGYFQDLYSISQAVFIMALKTADKRVIDRIGKEISEIDYSRYVSIPLSTGVGCLLLSKPVPPSTIIEMLLKLSNVDLHPLGTVFYMNKLKSAREELLSSLILSIKNALDNQLITLEYFPIGAWEKREIHFLEASISSRLLFGNNTDFRDSLTKGNLLSKYESAFSKALVKDIKTYNQHANKTLGFIYRLDPQAIRSQTIFESIIKDFTKSKSIQKQIIICLDYSAMGHGECLKIAGRLLELGFKLALCNWFVNFPGAELKKLSIFDLVFIEESDMTNGSDVWIMNIKDHFPTGVIYDHKNTSLRRSFLLEKKLNLIKGGFYATIPSMEMLLSITEKMISSEQDLGE